MISLCIPTAKFPLNRYTACFAVFSRVMLKRLLASQRMKCDFLVNYHNISTRLHLTEFSLTLIEFLRMKCEFQVNYRNIQTSLRLPELSPLLFVHVINFGSSLDSADFPSRRWEKISCNDISPDSFCSNPWFCGFSAEPWARGRGKSSTKHKCGGMIHLFISTSFICF